MSEHFTHVSSHTGDEYTLTAPQSSSLQPVFTAQQHKALSFVFHFLTHVIHAELYADQVNCSWVLINTLLNNKIAVMQNVVPLAAVLDRLSQSPHLVLHHQQSLNSTCSQSL